MFRRILLAYDDSAPARKAFDRLLKTLADPNAELAILSVIRSSEFAVEGCAQSALDGAMAHLMRQAGQLQQRAALVGLKASAMVRIGHPARQIALAAEEWRADLIVTGRRPPIPFVPWLWLTSSVSSQVLALARCAVLVVP